MNRPNGWGSVLDVRAWNTFVEETVSTKKESSVGRGQQSGSRRAEPVVLKDIRLSEDERQLTKIGELDRVLGGGIVPGSLVLVGGDPGIGKSTLLLQVCRNLGIVRQVLFYIFPVRNHCVRSSCVQNESESLMKTFNYCVRQIWKSIREVIERKKPDMVVIDSIQTMFHEDISSAPGSVSQVRESTNVLMQIAKGTGHIYFYCRTCDKRGKCCRPKSIGAYGGYGALF